MWELDGYISSWNKAAEETYGFTRAQAIGRKPHELLFEQLLGNLVHNAWKYTDSGGHIDVSLEIEEAQRGKAVREAVIRVRPRGSE